MPVTTSVNEPVEDDESALTVRLEVAYDSDSGVTGPGRLIETPVGANPTQEKLNVTAELNPLSELTLMTDAPLEPSLIEIEVGLADNVKSGSIAGIIVMSNTCE